MGDVQNPDGFPSDAVEASPGSVQAGVQEDIEGLWAEFAQLVGHADIEDYYIWWENHLTHDSCIRYRVRAEGGQRFL